jgi:putative endonuclease
MKKWKREWKREWKINLIVEDNLDWDDLSRDWFEE